MIAGLKFVGGETEEKKAIKLRALSSDGCVKKRESESARVSSLYTQAQSDCEQDTHQTLEGL